MMTPFEAVQSGMGFDKTGHWHQARPRLVSVRRKPGDDPIAPARGAIFGLLFSGVFWIGLVLVVRSLIRLF